MGYTVEEKATAVAICRRFGISKQALDEIEQALGRRPSKSSLSGWMKNAEPSRTEPNSEAEPNRTQKKTIIPASAIEIAEDGLDDLFERVARRYLKHALKAETIEGLKGRDAVIAAATATDKMRLLRNLPTEVVQVLPQLLMVIEQKGLSAGDLLNALLVELISDS